MSTGEGTGKHEEMGDEMTVVQRCWYITARDQGQDGYVAEANYADTFLDQALILKVERKTLKITDAVLEFHRGEQKSEALVPIPSLVGITAYFGCGKQLRQAVGDKPEILEMASHAVTAIIQAETFFYQERGFETAEIYEDFWRKNYKGSCVYYSNLERVQQPFMVFVKDHKAGNNLFHRFLCTALEISGEKPEIRSHLSDSFHEMSLNLTLDQDSQIQKASGAILRCPDAVCRESLDTLDSLKGMPLAATELKRLQAICGASAGCIHVGQMMAEAAYTMEIYKNRQQQP